MTALIIIWILAAIIATIIGNRKGYPIQGFFLGLILGWIGVLAISLWRPSHAEMVRREEEHLRVQREARSREEARP
jgi:hypothetical protein